MMSPNYGHPKHRLLVRQLCQLAEKIRLLACDMSPHRPHNGVEETASWTELNPWAPHTSQRWGRISGT